MTCSPTGGKTFTESMGKVNIALHNPNKNIRPAVPASRAFYIASETLMEKPKSRFIKTDDNTIYDSLTSLMWMANDSRLDLDQEVSWDEANGYAKETNEKKFAGHSDWRLPTIHEASSLYEEEKLNKDFKGGDIKVDSVFPPGAGNCSWTSDERGNEAQIVFYLNGCPYWYDKNDKTISHAVRLVRRG